MLAPYPMWDNLWYVAILYEFDYIKSSSKEMG